MQLGRQSHRVKVLKGFGGASVQEIIVNQPDGTFRVVYTVKFAEVIYVLHAFQKKSKSGIKTPVKDLDLIRQRLKFAETSYEEWKAEQKNVDGNRG